MGTTQSNNLAQTPDNTPIADIKTGRVNFIWNQWFTNVQIKLNTITAAIIALSKNATAGFLASDGAGGIFSRTLTPGTGITITNPTGAGGNPVISASASGGSPINIVNNTSTTYTVQATDLPSSSSSVGWVASNVSSANTIQIDTHVNQVIPAGAHLYVSEEGAGTTTIQALLGVSFVGNPSTAVSKGVGELVQIAIDTWHIFGNLSFIAGTTWNPSDKSSYITLSNTNLTANNTDTSVWSSVRASKGLSSGKVYFEIHVDSSAGSHTILGIMTGVANLSSYVGSDVYGWGYHGATGNKYHGGTNSAFGSAYTVGDVIGIAIDFSAGYIWFAKNNTWQASGDPSTGVNPAFTTITGTIFPAGSLYDVPGAITGNFITTSLVYTPPTGFNPWG